MNIILKVVCRVQKWKKTFCQNSDKFGYSFIKNDVMFMYLLCIYKKPIILSLFKIYKLHHAYFNDFDMAFKLHNLISVNIFFTIKDQSFSLSL